MEERSSKSGEASIQVMSNPVRVYRRYAIVDGVMIQERVRREARGLLRRRPEAYLFATTLKHLNRDDCVPPNEELGRGKLPVDLLRTNGSRTELLNRFGPEPEPYATLPDHGSLYGPPTWIIRWCGTDDEPRVVIVKPDGNFPGVLVHCCVSGKATDAADAAKLVIPRRARRDLNLRPLTE